MRNLLLRSLAIALVVGSCIGFADFVASVRGATKYDPPIAEEELQKLRQLPVEKYAEALSTRRKFLTRTQWLEDSIGYAFFWKDVAGHCVIPVLGVFMACIWIGRMQAQKASHPSLEPARKIPD